MRSRLTVKWRYTYINMGIYVARHGVSGANDAGNPAFGSPEAHLLPEGIGQAVDLGESLVPIYGIDPVIESVAVSRMTRTQETAHHAGFVTTRQYALLDEVSHGLDLEGFMRMKQTRQLPAHVMRAAEATLNNPPRERFWISHGLRIAAMCQILDVYQDEERLFQRFCEVRYLSI